MGKLQPFEPEITRALSLRQPFPERILKGTKRIEWRSRRTHITGRVYLYAAKALADIDDLEPGDELLPRGVIVGSVELVKCDWNPRYREWEWSLRAPHRYAKAIQPKGVPQPGFWFPRLPRAYRGA
jgi:hypothetical protein